MKLHAKAEITLFSSDKGGFKNPIVISPDPFRIIFLFPGYDTLIGGAILGVGVKELAPGTSQIVNLFFMYPNGVKQSLKKTSEFVICDPRKKGKGKILKTYPDFERDIKHLEEKGSL